MSTQKTDTTTFSGKNMLYLFSRCIIKHLGESSWHKIINEYTNRGFYLDMSLSYEDELFGELVQITNQFTGISHLKILEGFDNYLSSLNS
ncbi:MAG: hypothetical protein ACXAD7_03080 [Candidatus Kariarchaeaceae archaeon]|jgi:hypothetical protein